MTTNQLATQQATTIDSLRKPIVNDISIGFGTLQSFELMQRAAKLLCSSTLVPTSYQAQIVKRDKFGNVKSTTENPSAIANAVVALNMATRLGADPLMIMQNLYVIEGRPSWSSQFIIAAINGCGKFSPLRFTLEPLGEKTVEFVETYWENNQRLSRTLAVDIADIKCVAWAIEKASGERLESPPVTIEMAVKEGWFTKNGSKWQTMPEVMLRYRTASFFGKLYAPELLMGLKTMEEEQDVIEVIPETGEVVSVTTESLRSDMKTVSEPAPEPSPSTSSAQKQKSKPAPEQKQQPDSAPEPEKKQDKKHPEPEKKQEPEPEQKQQPAPESKKEPAPEQKPQQQSIGSSVSPVVQKYMREINQASVNGSLAVDQWSQKHHQRVARECGSYESEDYVNIMNYARLISDECKANEQSE